MDNRLTSDVDLELQLIVINSLSLVALTSTINLWKRLVKYQHNSSRNIKTFTVSHFSWLKCSRTARIVMDFTPNKTALRYCKSGLFSINVFNLIRRIHTKLRNKKSFWPTFHLSLHAEQHLLEHSDRFCALTQQMVDFVHLVCYSKWWGHRIPILKIERKYS